MITSTWLRNWKRSLERRWALHQALRRKPMSRRLVTRPRLEALEDRLVLSPYTVTSTLDDGSVGTLRDAIKEVNLGKANEIDFRIGTPGSAQTINITSQLPVLKVNNVFINGINTMGGSTQNTVTLNGSSAGAGVDGLILEGTGCTVSGLVIENFTGNGIGIDNGSGDSIGDTATGAGNVLSGNSKDGIIIGTGVTGIQVQGNYIGTDATGNAVLGNSGYGIDVLGGSNVIGGTANGAQNIISGNSKDGVLIITGTGNQVLGNNIGTNAAGNAALGNKGNGITVDSNNNTIGGTTQVAGNVISSNGLAGVQINSGITGTLIDANEIGTNYDGIAALGNGTVTNTAGSGIVVKGSNNIIGGTGAEEGNVISGNTWNGVWIQSGTGNQLLGNYIGTNFDGNAALGNVHEGIRVDSSNNTVGGTTAAAGNVVSGNSVGVLIFGGGNQVLANYVGTNFNGTAAVGNGIGIELFGNVNTIGSTASGAGNLISGNSGDGLRINSGVTETKVLGNTIGANFDTSAALGNSIGIDVLGSNNTIGSSFFSGNNVISGNNTGVLIASGVTGVQVLGGIIGLNATQTAKLANGIGIDVAGSNNTIGGTAFGQGAVISGNTTDGVKIESAGSGNLVLGQHIGTESGGGTAFGNGTGIEVDGNNNTIGATVGKAFTANLISGNSGDGVLIDHGGSGNQVLGNEIGTNQAGTAALANSIGIELNGNSNMIGSTIGGSANLISGNSSDGVLIDKGAGGNQVTGQDRIGINASDNAALPNGIGVEVAGFNNSIGITGLGNFISGNSSQGVLIDKDGSGNQVLFNHIGTNPAGTSALANSVGVEVVGTGNTIGGNLISGNSNQGVRILGSGNLETNDAIGTDVTRKAAVSNNIGVEVDGNSNTVDGGNIISGNTTDGVFIAGSGNVLLANHIGTDSSDTVAEGNNIGIEVAGTGNTIGRAGTPNFIYSNTKFGVVIDPSGSGNQVQGNFIGAAKPLANNVGIKVLGINNTIGGVGQGNQIAGNTNQGVFLVGSGNQVLGNSIGLTLGNAALGNSIGIEIAVGLNTIGGTASGSGNIISGNSSDGVRIDSGANANQVLNNTIGLNATGGALGNGGWGVNIASSNNTIGGSVSGAGNTIANNVKGGVLVSAGSGNTIRLNSIFANNSTNTTSPGITLSSGANNNLAAPILTDATLLNGKLSVTGTFNVPKGGANVIYTLDFYANPMGDAEGKIFIGSFQVKPASEGTQQFSPPAFTTSVTIANPIITATVTDASGNTSAFSEGKHDPIVSSLPTSSPPTSVAPTSSSLPTAPVSNSMPATPPLPTPLEVALDTAALLLQGNALALFELNSLSTMFLGHSLPPSSQLLSTALSDLGAPDGAGLIGLQLGLSLADSLEGTMT